eukprot:gb/GECG01008735.1/.p1 GENE.gb/GECG01008735.1/~~gb/GECG01008735.1/.p1  ORF type:complete len:339 (+),score=17.21 gb/GECG01008735.1/:1-1017(+)
MVHGYWLAVCLLVTALNDPYPTMGEDDRSAPPAATSSTSGLCGAAASGILLTNILWATFFLAYFRTQAYVDLVPGLFSRNTLVYEPSNFSIPPQDPLSTVCEHFRASMVRSNSTVSNHPLIIMTGEGTTATRAVAEALAEMGLQIGHWQACKGCTHWNHMKWRRILSQLRRSTLDTISHATLRELEFLDGIGDQPVNNLIPELLSVFPRARILLTTRNATAWAKSRYEHHGGAPVPLVPAIIPYNQITRRGPTELRNRGASPKGRSFMFGAQNLVSACLSRQHEFLHLDISAHQCDSRLLWKRLAQFARVERIPAGSFPGCKPLWEQAAAEMKKQNLI